MTTDVADTDRGWYGGGDDTRQGSWQNSLIHCLPTETS